MASFRDWVGDNLRHNDGRDPDDIFWIGIDPHVERPKADETWYRGQWHDTSRLGRITWWTRSKADAGFYSQGEGRVYEAEIDPQARFGTYKDLVRAVRETDARRSEIKGTSGFDGTNDNDFLYLPKVQKSLSDKGFDAMLLSDVMGNYEIDAMVVLNQRILRPK